MSAPPATINVSTGPVTSVIGEEANSSPQLARTGPPRVVTTWVRYRTAGRKREALEKTSRGPVTSRIWAESKVTMTTPRSTGSSMVGSFEGRALAQSSGVHVSTVRRAAVADIVNNVSLWVARPGHTLKDMKVAYPLSPGSPHPTCN